MSVTNILYHWSQAVRKSFTALSKPQAYVLAAFSLGLGRARRCALARVAESLFWLGKPDSLERRLQRFLSNEHIDWQLGCQNLSAWVLRSLVFAQRTLVLLVDETSLAEHLKVMAVSLAYRGRAIPLAWWCYRQEHYPTKQVRLIDTLLGWITPHIPEGHDVLVEADRGIGTSPSLLRRIEKRGWHFLVRVQGSVRLKRDDGSIVPFRSLVRAPGQQWSGWVQAFRKAGWRRCWAIAYWGKGHKEPWLLLSDQAEVSGQRYGWRMWEELAFRDFKSTGWHWQKSRVWDPAHANRLWLVMALAYAWALSLGTQVAHWVELQRQLMRGRKRRLSFFALGLRAIQCALLTISRKLWFFDFMFIPAPNRV